MKLTESMIRDLVTTSLSAEEIGDLLTMVGFEIEEITVVEGENVLDINIMANRGDGASALGLAREILAKDEKSSSTDLYRKLASGNKKTDEGESAASLMASAKIETKDCTRFTARVFEGLAHGEAPDWIKDRLTKVGLRPISLLVDLTNYVMLETGQPMHAYDLDKLSGHKLIVRSANTGEKLTTLDGNEHALKPGQMMICDAERPVGAAGVMGGLDTEVTESTTRILLEAAHFDHQSVRKTRKALGLQTDASYRFERYADPEGCVRSMNRFADLLKECAGIEPVPGVIDLYPTKPVRESVKVRTSRCCLLLGMTVTSDEVEQYLSALGSKVERHGDDFFVTPPSWRIDLVREDDYVEEVGRVHGYEKIPQLLPIGSTPVGGTHGKDALVERVREQLYRCGIHQAISHTLRDLHPLDRLGDRVVVRNPHSPEIAHLRNSILPSLSDAATRNGGKDVHFFETGKVFAPGQEMLCLGVLSVGVLDCPTWSKSDKQQADFFSLKGILDSVLSSINVDVEASPITFADDRFHPTRSASLGDFGVFGQIHPVKAEEIGLPVETVLAEINLDKLAEAAPTSVLFKAVHRHPATRRDIAVLIDKSVPYSSIESAINKACGELLEKQWLFDVYSGQGIEQGKHSLAIALQFRKHGTFTDDEANQVRDAAVLALEGLGAKLR